MRQAPKYILVGSGRVARHFSYYLSLLAIPHEQWCRRNNDLTQLKASIANASHVLLLMHDAAIENFILQHRELAQKVNIHFSGHLTTNLAVGVHPLMSFTHELYSLEEYKNIPFIIEDSSYEFHDLFPALPNPAYKILKAQKALYHSLCVLSGNFTCILWDKFFMELERTCNIPRSAAYPYLQRITNNLLANSSAALTGPLTRKDAKTIQANLQALENDAFQEIYQAFVNVYTQNTCNNTQLY